jgi:hypothetical protein
LWLEFAGTLHRRIQAAADLCRFGSPYAMGGTTMADLVVCVLGVIIWAAWSLRFLSLLIAEVYNFGLKRGGEAARQKRQTEI